MSAGHRFRPNGDLELAYHRPPLLLIQVWGFRAGEKVLVDSWAEPRCPVCGCPRARYHARGCKEDRP